MATDSERLRRLRDLLNQKLHQGLDEIYINGSMEHRLPHNLNISFAYVEGESLLMGINDVAVSSGSACTSASLEPSYVLKALGAGDDLAHSSIRFGLGRWTTEEEIDYVADKLISVVTRLREITTEIQQLNVSYDEWQIVYRQALQLAYDRGLIPDIHQPVRGAFAPGVALVLVVIACTLLGDALRDALAGEGG